MSNRVPVTSDLIQVLGALFVAVSLVACGAARESEPDAPSTAGGSTVVASGAAEPGGGGSARNFQTLDLCALLPVADVATILDRDPRLGTAEATMGQWATDCTYSFERDGYTDYVMVWAYPPEFWTPETYPEAEKVTGLGDAAYLANLESFAQVNVLLEGDLYLDTRADTADQARRLAELAIERLARTKAAR